MITMGKNLQDIWAELPEERRQKIEARFQERLQEYYTLQELRKALDLTQENIAESLNIHQVNVSKLENRSDIKLSTLREYLAAMGGQLRLVVDFPDKPSVIIEGLGEPDDSDSSPEADIA
jgi:transcriptional regulator with XRE-family HTH domain